MADTVFRQQLTGQRIVAVDKLGQRHLKQLPLAHIAAVQLDRRHIIRSAAVDIQPEQRIDGLCRVISHAEPHLQMIRSRFHGRHRTVRRIQLVIPCCVFTKCIQHTVFADLGGEVLGTGLKGQHGFSRLRFDRNAGDHIADLGSRGLFSGEQHLIRRLFLVTVDHVFALMRIGNALAVIARLDRNDHIARILVIQHAQVIEIDRTAHDVVAVVVQKYPQAVDHCRVDRQRTRARLPGGLLEAGDRNIVGMPLRPADLDGIGLPVGTLLILHLECDLVRLAVAANIDRQHIVIQPVLLNGASESAALARIGGGGTEIAGVAEGAGCLMLAVKHNRSLQILKRRVVQQIVARLQTGIALEVIDLDRGTLIDLLIQCGFLFAQLDIVQPDRLAVTAAGEGDRQDNKILQIRYGIDSGEGCQRDLIEGVFLRKEPDAIGILLPLRVLDLEGDKTPVSVTFSPKTQRLITRPVLIVEAAADARPGRIPHAEINTAAVFAGVGIVAVDIHFDL